MILMYHHVAPADVVPRPAPPQEGWELTHSPSALAFHIERLLRRGRRFVSLEEYVASIVAHDRAPAGAVHLTFDDGWVDNFEFALPVLRAFGVPATFFVTTDHLCRAPDRRRMGINHLRELVEEGMTIGGHTRSHADLTALPSAAQRDEVAGCKRDLETALSCRIDWLAYPGGAFNPAVVDHVKAAGFHGAVCSLGPGRNNRRSRYWLFREVVGAEMNTFRDRARLSGPARRLWEVRVRRRLRLRHMT